MHQRAWFGPNIAYGWLRDSIRSERLSPSPPRTKNHRYQDIPVDRSARTRAAMQKAAFRVLLRLLGVELRPSVEINLKLLSLNKGAGHPWIQ